MKVSIAATKVCSLLFVFSIAAATAGAQQGGTAPSLQPVLSADRGMSAEIRQLELYKQANQAAMQAMHEAAEKNGTQKKTTGVPDTSCVITIPVVFHVFHPQGSAGVPLTQIDYAVKDLNITFAGADADYTTVNAAFATIKSYTKIRWKRALIDPKGNPTTGVVYYKDLQSGFGNGTEYDKQIRTCAWDNRKYFNVYIMNDLYCNNVTNNSGVCWYPNTTMTDSQTARMVYNYQYLGYGGSSFNDVEFNQTLTHEAGHFMNLMHTFEGTSCGGSGDDVADTPPTDAAASGCNAISCSNPINGENYMDYNSSCYKNFTQGQNDRMETGAMHASRFPLWQYANLVATGVISPTTTDACVMANKFFAYSKTKLDEDNANNGSIEMPAVNIYACAGLQFVKRGVALASGTDYTIANVPAGLNAVIATAADGKSATLKLNGTATSHLGINSTSNMTLTFKDVAIVGGSVATAAGYTQTFQINFKDPWSYTCAEPDLTATTALPWMRFETAGPMPRFFGLWYNAGKYYLENYGRAIMTESLSSDNIIFLPAGTTVGPASTWRIGGGRGVLYAPSYTLLDTKTGFIGFRMQAGNDFYYGWMQVSVSSVTGVTLLAYQYCNKPNVPIAAGSSCTFPVGVQDQVQLPNTPALYPNPTTGTVYITNMQPGSTAEVYDIAGRLLLKTAYTAPTETLDLSAKGLTNGTYIIKIISGNHEATMHRMVLNR